MNITWIDNRYGEGSRAKIAGGLITLVASCDLSIGLGERRRYVAHVGPLKIAQRFDDLEDAKAAAERGLMMKLAQAVRELGVG